MENSKLIEMIEEEGVFEVIANEYWQMTKEQLKSISLDAMWALEGSNGDLTYANKYVIEQLELEDLDIEL